MFVRFIIVLILGLLVSRCSPEHSVLQQSELSPNAIYTTNYYVGVTQQLRYVGRSLAFPAYKSESPGNSKVYLVTKNDGKIIVQCYIHRGKNFLGIDDNNGISKNQVFEIVGEQNDFTAYYKDSPVYLTTGKYLVLKSGNFQYGLGCNDLNDRSHKIPGHTANLNYADFFQILPPASK